MATTCGGSPGGADPPTLAVNGQHLAKLLGVGLRTVRAMDAAGKLPAALRFAGKRWRLAEIEAWLAAGAPDRKTWEVIRDGQ